MCANNEGPSKLFSHLPVLRSAQWRALLLYKLKSDKQSLLPEAKNLDYLWMIQSSAPGSQAVQITEFLRTMPDIQLAQIISPDKLKNLSNLLV